MKKMIFIFFAISFVNDIYTVELNKFIPQKSELGIFEMREEPATYTPENLWNYINGAAPGYLAYGFKELITFILYYPKDSTEYAIDIYEMTDSLNAFGIYSKESDPEGKKILFTRNGFITGNVLYFWQNRYYIKLIAYDESCETPGLLNQLGEIISKKLPLKGSTPNIFSIFPSSGKIAKSACFLPVNVLGQDYFKNGFIVDYSVKADKFKILFLNETDLEKAKSNFQKFFKYINETGKVLITKKKSGNESFIGIDDYYGKIHFCRNDATLFAVIGLDDQNMTQSIIEKMIIKYSQLKK